MSRAYFLTISILVFLSLDLSSQRSSDFDIFQYRHVGPFRGGRVTAVAGCIAQPNVFYMGATGGGVWKTDDYGVSWKNISDGYFATPSIGSIAVSESDEEILYVGTGSDGLRSNVITGKGVYKTTDGGDSWTEAGLKNTGQIGAVRIHPDDNNKVYVAAIGQAFNANKERGVFRTIDGGKNWKKILFISDTTGVSDIEFRPDDPNTLFATAWRAERKPWTIISGGKENGIYRTRNGGDKWEKVGNGLPELMGKIDLTISKANPNILYALVEAKGKKAGLYKSENDGNDFVQVSDKFQLLHRPFYYTNVIADPTDENTIYVLENRFHKSTDGGQTWSSIATPHGDNHDLWINPNNPQLMVQGNDGGANVSHNGGKTWSNQFNQPTAEIYQVEVDNQHPYWLYGGQQDNYTTISVPSLPPHGHQAGGIGYIMNTGGCETGPAVPHPINSNIVYSNCKGRFSVFNKSTGQEKRYDVGAAFMYGHNTKDLKLRFQRVSPIHISPHDPGTIYHTSQHVHKTTDEGLTWTTISPDLTAFEPDKQVRSGGPITNDITGEEFYSTIYSIQESKIEKGVIYVGANDGPVHITKDGGKNWQNITPENLPKGGRVDCVEPSPHKKDKAFITVLRYQLGDWTPYIFRTTNYGKNWNLVNKGIPSDFPVRVVREDPEREGLLYCGTEFGMFISFDDGDSWQSFQQNLPVTPITDIKVHRHDLVLSTMGRGFHIIDNLNTLHQEFESTKESNKPVLYEPSPTIRYRYRTTSDVRLPAPNVPYPRPSAIIDYYLPDSISGGIQLTIKDTNGKLIKAFSSESQESSETTSRDMSTNEFYYTYMPSLKNEKGWHRFNWDMKHMGAWDKSNNKKYKRGPYVAPGIYKLELKLNSETLSQELNLQVDPRVLKSGVTLDDLQAQEELSLKIINLLSTARLKANELKEEIDQSGETDKDKVPALQKKYDELVSKKGRYTETKFISQVEYLLGIIRNADQRPGKDVYDRYEELLSNYDKLFKP